MNMQRNQLFLLTAFMLVSCVFFTACGGKRSTPAAEVQDTAVVAEESYMDAVNDYLVDSIGHYYLQGEVCIPYAFIVNTNEDNAEDILVWGDFWVFQYNLVGDTLQTVSGGNHPGLMHLKKTADGYEVTGFDGVVDGAGNLASAKRIFGQYYDLYHEFSSNEEVREKTRAEITSQYVRKHQLKATCYQDYGWPAVPLP